MLLLPLDRIRQLLLLPVVRTRHQRRSIQRGTAQETARLLVPCPLRLWLRRWGPVPDAILSLVRRRAALDLRWNVRGGVPTLRWGSRRPDELLRLVRERRRRSRLAAAGLTARARLAARRSRSQLGVSHLGTTRHLGRRSQVPENRRDPAPPDRKARLDRLARPRGSHQPRTGPQLHVPALAFRSLGSFQARVR